MPADPLRKINNLSADQFTTLFHGYTWVTGVAMPPILASWNRWSIALHFTLALLGVAAVRDSNPVVAHKILELKAETAKQDLITIRKAAMLGNPLVLLAAKLRGLLDGAKLARELLGGKVDIPADYTTRIDEITRGRLDQINVWSGLYLPGAFPENSQAGNKINPDGVSKSPAYPAQVGEQRGEQRGEQHRGGESGARQMSINKPDGKDCVMDKRSAQENEDRGEQDFEVLGAQVARSSQWMKSILPEASNGWWDIRDKGGRIVVKFRWRDPDLQVITPLRLMSEQLETLKRSDYEEAKSRALRQTV